VAPKGKRAARMVTAILELTVGKNDGTLPADGRDFFLFDTSAFPVLLEGTGGRTKRCGGFCRSPFSTDCC